MKAGAKFLVLFLLIVLFLAASIMFFIQRRESEEYGGIAVVSVTGVIYESRSVVELLRGYEENPAVKAFVVRIDSPGGGVAASQEIYSELARIRDKGEKPVVASLGGVAASGGYYIACAAEKIIANPGTVTGSIGAIINTVNMKDLFSKLGISHTAVKSGDYKDSGSSSRELTREETVLFQGLVDNIHGQFLSVVAERRGLSEDELALVADGRIVTGEQALGLNLLDGIGTFYEAVEDAASLAGLKRWDLIEQRRRRTLRDVVFGLLPQGSESYFAPLYILQRGR